MKRRDFIAAFSSAAIVWPLSSAHAEPERTLALLVPYSESDPAAVGYVNALREGLAALGWREGENLKIELRWSADEAAPTRAYAKELVELRPAVIVATGPAFAIMREATRTIPIVFRRLLHRHASATKADLVKAPTIRRSQSCKRLRQSVLISPSQSSRCTELMRPARLSSVAS